MAESLGVDMPIMKSSNEQYLKALQNNLGDKDFSAVYEQAISEKSKK